MGDIFNLASFTAELEAIQNSETIVSSVQNTTDEFLSVDANERLITVSEPFKSIGVWHDHNARTVYLKVSRYFDDVDLATKTCVILYKRADGQCGVMSTSTAVNGDEITIGWTITHECTATVGILYFALCFYHISTDTQGIKIYDYQWSTLPAQTTIMTGLDLIDSHFYEYNADKLQELMYQIKGINDCLDTKADKVNEYGGFQAGQDVAIWTGSGGVAIGKEAELMGGGGAIGSEALTQDGGAVGNQAYSYGGAAVGRGTKTSDGVAVGLNAKTVDNNGYGIDAIQLGTGTNRTEKTLQVYDYTLMKADGKVPEERLPTASVEQYGVVKISSAFNNTSVISDGDMTFSDTSVSAVVDENGDLTFVGANGFNITNGNIAFATNNSGLSIDNGVIQVNTLNDNGIEINQGNVLSIVPASQSEIDEKQSSFKPIVPSTLEYAVRSVTTQDVEDSNNPISASAVKEMLDNTVVRTDMLYDTSDKSTNFWWQEIVNEVAKIQQIIDDYVSKTTEHKVTGQSSGFFWQEIVDEVAKIQTKADKDYVDSERSILATDIMNIWETLAGKADDGATSRSINSILDLLGDFEIVPVVENVTEKLVLKASWISVADKYCVYAGDTPFTDTMLGVNETTITAIGGFEGENIRVKFYDFNENELCTTKLTVRTINGRKIGQLLRVYST